EEMEGHIPTAFVRSVTFCERKTCNRRPVRRVLTPDPKTQTLDPISMLLPAIILSVLTLFVALDDSAPAE
ncbi:MAG TPA: hypothetical protein VG734_01640, partial [Lacunisphaera sp.]|nr:hypothetical protein [Lacunisphaera sp.]